MKKEITFLLLFLSVLLEGKKKTTTAPPVGVWGPWDEWDEHCSVTCGIGVRRRVRSCSYEGRQKEKRCQGDRGQLKNCDTGITCPVHGGWSPWVAWRCSATCGGGIGRQSRECTNPKPMFNGKDCEGPKEEEGKCNTQSCPDQVYTLTPETAQAVKDSIDKVHFNFQKKEGDGVRIPCSPTILAKIYREYPESSLTWTKNGKILELDQERMKVTPTELQISKLKPEDNGVYVCTIHYVPAVAKPVAVASVTAVSSTPNFQIPAEENLRLICHGSQLAKIYKNLTQTWHQNDKMFKEFKKGSPIENNVYYVEHVKPNMTGMWSCQITEPASGRSWITNTLTLKVLPPIPKYLKFLYMKNLLLIIGIVLLLTIMSVGTFCGYLINKSREEFLKDFEKWNEIVQREEHNAEGVPAWMKSSTVTPVSSENDQSSTEE